MLENQDASFGLTPRDIKTIKDILMKYPEVSEARIFGSRAKGDHKPGSDIDMAIMNSGVNDKMLSQIKSDLEDSTLPYTIDVIDYTSLSHTDLKEHILRVGKVFYSR